MATSGRLQKRRNTLNGLYKTWCQATDNNAYDPETARGFRFQFVGPLVEPEDPEQHAHVIEPTSEE